jgi:hypothetical protein
MNSDRDPGGRPLPQAEQARLQAMLTLKARLQELHAELEFLRLMLKLRLPH